MERRDLRTTRISGQDHHLTDSLLDSLIPPLHRFTSSPLRLCTSSPPRLITFHSEFALLDLLHSPYPLLNRIRPLSVSEFIKPDEELTGKWAQTCKNVDRSRGRMRRSWARVWFDEGWKKVDRGAQQNAKDGSVR